MRLAVISHKECVPDLATGRYYTDGGFPMQIGAIAELFDETRVVVPSIPDGDLNGLTIVDGNGMSVVPLDRLSGKNWRRKLRFPAWLLKNSRLIWNEVRRADAVHTPIPGDIGTIGLVFALVQRKPLFVRHCGNWMVQTTLAERFWKWSMETFAGGRNVMLATGGSENPPSQKNSRVRWIFSTSLRNDQLQDAKPKTLPAKGQALRLVIACRQENRKGTDVVVRSLPMIRELVGDVELTVIGDGSRLPALKSLARDLGVESNLNFLGKVRQTEVTDLLKTAHIFCYPTSASEGFPKVVLEALASGLPVITTRVSVLPQLIGEGGGVLIDADPAQLAEAVVKLSKDPQAYEHMSAAAITTARRFTLENWRDYIAENLSEAWTPIFVRTGRTVLRGDGSQV